MSDLEATSTTAGYSLLRSLFLLFAAMLIGAVVGIVLCQLLPASGGVAIVLCLSSGFVIGLVVGRLAVSFSVSRPIIRGIAALLGVVIGVSVVGQQVDLQQQVFAGIQTTTQLVFGLIVTAAIAMTSTCIAVVVAVRQKQGLGLSRTELPLLRRELTELANRRRTYVVRIVGAAVILVLVIYKYHMVLSAKMQQRGAFGISGPTQFLGIGQDIFAGVVPQLFAVISLLLPALCCASVTSEKESNTIGTLLLTRLSPGTIVVEKFGSRLIPMLTLLLLTFPVLAHVYALGGVDTDLLIGTIWLLLCQCFLVAAMAIACSAWFASTVSAFICSYALVGFFAALTYSLRWSSFVPSAIWTDQFKPTDPMGQHVAAFGGPTVAVRVPTVSIRDCCCECSVARGNGRCCWRLLEWCLFDERSFLTLP